MISDFAVGWSFLSIFVMLAIGFSGVLVGYYTDRHERRNVASWVAVGSLAVTILCVLAVPLDIITVDEFLDERTGEALTEEIVASRERRVREVYFVLYSMLIACAFFLIPFSYFYIDADRDTRSSSDRVIQGLKYAVLFVIVVAVLLVLGIYFQAEPDTATSAWSRHILLEQSEQDAAVNFVVSCMACVGLGGLCTYTAYGIVNVPLDLLMFVPRSNEDAEDAARELAETKERLRAMTSKYSLTGRRMSRKDKRDYGLMQDAVRVLERRTQRLESERGGLQRLVSSAPLLVRLLGTFLLLVALLFVAALFATTLDRSLHSDCQEQCGWTISNRRVWNPLDELLTEINQLGLHPLDHVVIGSCLALIAVASLGGMVSLGVRFVCVELYKLRPYASAPQSLLLTIFHLSFIMMLVNAQLLTLAPQYFTFGAQTYGDSRGRQRLCTLDQVREDSIVCRMTQISTILHQSVHNLPFFGVVYFVGNWLFFAALFAFAVARIVRGKPKDGYPNDDDEEESRGLL